MTRIDFYVLDENSSLTREQFVCRLVEKAYHKSHQIYLQAENQAQVQYLDDLMWTHRQGSFLPHIQVRASAEPDNITPIQVSHGEDQCSHDDVLVNLATDVPLFFSRFHRVAEIIPGDASLRAQARERFRFYRDRGYTLHTHQITEGQ